MRAEKSDRMLTKKISLNVNSVSHNVEIDTRSRLVDVIRDKLGLTGTHLGCGTGNCGACTVLLNGRTAKSCCVLAVDEDSSEIVTIEGVASGEGLHPIQQAFVDNHGLQCGFCTPGMILSTVQLMEENSNPNDGEIRDAIAGNICRCTGYVNIIASIKDAARRLADTRTK
jgi:aerobic carbon-monoxide dehydrogenase small subunit